MDWVALAAVIAGPGVAAIAIIASRLDGRENREHALSLVDRQHEVERALRRSDRLFERRSEVYVELLRSALRTVLSIDRTHPIMGPQPEPPTPISEEEWMSLEARTSAFGSTEVVDAATVFVNLSREFTSRVLIWEGLERQGGGPLAIDARRALDDTRGRAKVQSIEVARLIREELADL